MRLVLAERCGRCVIATKRTSQCVAGETCAEQTVVDAAAGRRLDDAGRIAEHDDTLGKGALDGAERQNLLPRLACRALDTPARTDVVEHPIEVAVGVMRAHHADAHVRTLALHRHGPREAARRHALAEMHFDVTEPARRQFGLRRMQQQARHPQPQLALDGVARAAGQHADARMNRRARRGDAHAAAVDGDVRHALAVRQLRAGEGRALRQPAIEPRAIDHDGFDRRRRVLDRVAGRRVKLDGSELIQDAVVGELELLERVGGEDAGAMHRLAAGGMFLEERDAEAGAGKLPAGVKPRGAPADNDCVVHIFHPLAGPHPRSPALRRSKTRSPRAGRWRADYTGFLRTTNQICVAKRGPSHGSGDATTSSIVKRRVSRSRSTRQLKPL